MKYNAVKAAFATANIWGGAKDLIMAQILDFMGEFVVPIGSALLLVAAVIMIPFCVVSHRGGQADQFRNRLIALVACLLFGLILGSIWLLFKGFI